MVKIYKTIDDLNVLPENLPTFLTRQESQTCSIELVKTIFNITNTSITKIKIFEDEHHGDQEIHGFQTINLFNYYFFDDIKKNFLNEYLIHEHNIHNIINLLDKDIIGIQVSLHKHATCLFKCSDNYSLL
jgi:hypothetical protein